MTTCSLDAAGLPPFSATGWAKHVGRVSNEERCVTEKLSPKEVVLAWNERYSKKDVAGSMSYMAPHLRRYGDLGYWEPVDVSAWQEIATCSQSGVDMKPEMHCSCCHTHDEPEFDNV
jgi:hypothetical protein